VESLHKDPLGSNNVFLAPHSQTPASYKTVDALLYRFLGD